MTATAEIYTPATGQWAPARAMTVAREDATATLLLNGKVLVAGGTDGTKVLSKSELYDPATNTWTAARR
ncbi:MAG: kelch repeat-containing protein [Thermoleophilia bacterium]